MMSTVANGGTRFVPQLLKAVNEGKRMEAGPAAARPSRACNLKPETISALHDGLFSS